MTLDFKKLVRNAVRKQMVIQHFECNVQIFKQGELPQGVEAKVQEAFGADFLADANYTLWFSGRELTREVATTTLFKIANKALGEAANSLAESDVKMVDLVPAKAVPQPEGDADEANSKAVADALTSESVESPEPGERFAFVKITMK